MQAKDIPDELILNYLYNYQGRWTMLFGLTFSTWIDEKLHEEIIVPPETPSKVLHAKMKSLYKRGLVGGCDCGCRGDFEITDKGLELIGQSRTKPYTGY
jgi:hypothetical protein